MAAIAAVVGIGMSALISKNADKLLDAVFKVFVQVRKPFRAVKRKMLDIFGKKEDK